MKYIWMILIISLLTIVAACQPTGSPSQVPQPQDTAPQTDLPASIPQSSATQDSARTSTPEDVEVSTPITPDASTEQIITLVKQHLAKQLSISVDQIILTEVKPVVWRDAGLGCPKPGVDYIQMETPGYSIFLEAGGNTYNYHTDEIKRFVLCSR